MPLTPSPRKPQPVQQSALTATVENMASPSTISPKVSIPTLVGVGVGFVLIVISLISDEIDLTEYGIGVLLAALGYGGIGYNAPVGKVAVSGQQIETRRPQ